MVAGSAAFFYEHGGSAASPSNKCRYKTGKCTNTRSSKRNGQPHMLCLYHRDKANKIQRKFDRQKRQSVRQKKSSSAPSSNSGSPTARGSASSSRSILAGGAASAFANSMANTVTASSFTGLLAQQDVDIYSDSDSSRFSTDSESSTVSLDQVWQDLPNSALLVGLVDGFSSPVVASTCGNSAQSRIQGHMGSGPLSHEEIDFLDARVKASSAAEKPPPHTASSLVDAELSASAAELPVAAHAMCRVNSSDSPAAASTAARATHSRMMAVELPASIPPLLVLSSSPSNSSSINDDSTVTAPNSSSHQQIGATVQSARKASVPWLLESSPTARMAIDLSPNHLKLLYLISLYAVAANSTKTNERWIRHIPLLVLMFEGIVRGALGFDYAPASMPLSFKGKTLRRWINISREGKAAIDDLWELRLVNGIKLSSDDFQPVTAYQVSARGLDVLQRIPSRLRDQVDAFIYPPASYERRLLQVSYDGSRFVLKAGAFNKRSEVTESEDVSYVSSPFLPACLRSRGYYHVETRSNQHRARECAAGSTTISKSTSVAITLGDVYSLVGEWVPFGSNQIVALNERMGALDRCQGGILTSYIDNSPTDAQFEVPVGQTQVKILDYDFVRFINFEAESHFPETSGIVQVEHFGMHLNCDGSLIYGIKVEAILDRLADDICIDHLARLLVDVHQDSSMLVNDLLSRYQLSLLNMLYLGDSFQRNKYNCIIATRIEPKLPAAEYLANPVLANELAQVLGDIYACYDLSAQDLLIVGKAGCLVCGPHVFRFEHVLTKYVGLVCRDIFIRNFFARTFVLDATLRDIRQLLHLVHREPAVALQVREQLAVASKDTILLAETLEYLLDSLEDLELTCVCSSGSYLSGLTDADVEATLMQVLSLQQLKSQTIMRCHDSIKLMENTMLQLEQLQMISESTVTSQLEISCKRVHLNTRELINAISHQHSTRLTLQALQYIVSGVFVFDVIDRITGSTFHVHLPQWALDALVDPVLSKPFLWWGLNMVGYGIMLWLVHGLANIARRQPLGWCTVKSELNCNFNVAALDMLLQRKTVRSVVATQIGATSGSVAARFRIVRWQETDTAAWDKAAPLVELAFDEKHAFALFVSLQFDAKRTALREEELLALFHDLLVRHEVLEAPEKKKERGHGKTTHNT